MDILTKREDVVVVKEKNGDGGEVRRTEKDMGKVSSVAPTKTKASDRAVSTNTADTNIANTY